MNKIHILLPVYNRCDITKKFINCLIRQTYKNYRLILIDDGSTDGTAEMVQKFIPEVTIIRGKGDWWWAGSLQQGFNFVKNNKLPGDDLILIINDDTEIDIDFLKEADNHLKEFTRTLIQAECYSKESGKFLSAGAKINWSNFTFGLAKDNNEINCLSTRGLIMRVSDFIEIGGFHPIIMPHYVSDNEFTNRAYRKGFKLLTIPEFKLFVAEKETGLHFQQLKKLSFLSFISNYFSKRSVENPLIMLSLIILACPWKWKIPNILRVIKRFFLTIIEYTKG